MEVSKHPTDIALDDIRLARVHSLLGYGQLGLLFGADEKNLASGFGHSSDKLSSPLEKIERLVEVDDVDAGPLGEHILFHLRVPPARLVPEVDPGLQKFSDAYNLLCCTLHNSPFLGG